MRNLILSLVVGVITTSCAVNPLDGVDTYGLTYDGTNVYYNDELCAELSAVEVAYDDGKIVREATFVLVDQRFNEQAISIIKFIREGNPSMEVEVEICAE